MITVLDEREYYYWKPLHFIYDGETVCLRIEEQFLNEELENIKIGDKSINNVHKIVSVENSRQYDIIFNNVALFQVYEELRHIEDDNEIFDKGIIRKYIKSNLMNFIENNTTFKIEMPENYYKNLKHYCVKTSTDWFDIIALSDPIIKIVFRKNKEK